MITQLDGYFADQSARPRTYAEQLADDTRSADFIASITRGPAAVTRVLGLRALRRGGAPGGSGARVRRER